jgi:signal transduction histidine kinase
MAEQNRLLPGAKMTARRHAVLLIPLLSGLLIVVAIAVFAYWTQAGVSNSRNLVLHTYGVRTQLQTLETQLAEVRGSALAFAASGDAGQFRDFQRHAGNIARLTESLQTMTSDNPRQQYRLGELEALSKKYTAGLEKIATSTSSAVQRRPNPPGQSASIRELDSQESQLDAIVRSMGDDENMLLDDRLATWNRFFIRSAIILTVVLIATLVLFAYNFRLLTREVTRTQEMERVQRENVRSSRALSARILDLQDAERRKVARELHDSVGQYLVSLKINLEQLQNTSPNLIPPHSKLLSETVDLTERSIAEVRTISHLLHPPLLDEVGLESAARWYADGFAKRCGLKVDFQLSAIANRLPKEVELTLFRVLQESLTNVHRHANARSIEVVLTCRDGRVVLDVRDDGRGVSKEVLTRFRSGLASGVGLAGMKERLAELDGILEVETRTRGCAGTVVRATIPVSECDEPTRLDSSASN